MSIESTSTNPKAAWTVGLLTVLGIVLLFICFWLLFSPWFVLWIGSETFTYVVDNIVNVSGLSPYLVKGVVILALVPFGWAVAELLRFGIWDRIAAVIWGRKSWLPTKRIAAGLIVVYVASYFFAMYFAGRASYFGHSKQGALKYYAVTPEGIRWFDSPGFDPKYGLELRPATPEIVINLERAQRGLVPKRIAVASVADIEFFDTLTGQPRVWYFRDLDGRIELYSSAGRHPAFGDELKPVTKEVVQAIQKDLESKTTAQQGAALEAAKTKSESEARARLARYLNTVSPRTPLVLIVDESNHVDTDLTERLAIAVNGSGSVFKAAFVADGLFRNAYNGDSSVLRGLGLGEVPTVLLGIKHSTVTSDESLEKDYKRGETRLSVREYRPRDAFASRSVSVSAVGPGFSEGAAVQKADEAAAQQLVAKLGAGR